MTNRQDPDKVIERLKMILAEMGYRDVEMWHHNGAYRPDGTPVIASFADDVPAAIWWKASTLMGPHSCWSCYLDTHAQPGSDVGIRCSQGDCSNPGGPAEAPRELLIRKQEYQPPIQQGNIDNEWWRR
jgi:hypothetical protein